MAQAQATKTEFVTKTQSLSLMKNLLRVSLSEVCFIRNIFPSDAFEKLAFGNTEVRALKKAEHLSATNQEAHKLKQMEDSAYDALDKGYLKSVVFGIYGKSEEGGDISMLESYVFNVRYPSTGDVELTLQTDKAAFTLPRVRDEAVTLVRSLIRLTETLPSPVVPEDRLINMTLFYYDDRTPEGYQPPGFTDVSHTPHPTFLSEAVSKYTLGKVSSKHHSMTVKVAYGGPLREGGEGELDDMLLNPGNSSSATSAEAVQAGTGAPPAAAPPSAPHVLPLMDGIDPGVYSACKSAIAHAAGGTDGLLITLKFILETAVRCGAGDVSAEHARRVLRQLEAEGLLVRKGAATSMRFTVQSAVAAHICAQELAQAAAAPAPAAAAEDASAQAKAQAHRWYARAVCALMAGQCTSTSSSARPPSYITLAELAAAAGGVDAKVAERLAKKLEKEKLLLPPGAEGHPINAGRHIVAQERAQLLSLLDVACGDLRALGATVPPHAIAALRELKPKENSAARKRTPSPSAPAETAVLSGPPAVAQAPVPHVPVQADGEGQGQKPQQQQQQQTKRVRIAAAHEPPAPPQSAVKGEAVLARTATPRAPALAPNALAQNTGTGAGVHKGLPAPPGMRMPPVTAVKMAPVTKANSAWDEVVTDTYTHTPIPHLAKSIISKSLPHSMAAAAGGIAKQMWANVGAGIDNSNAAVTARRRENLMKL